MQEGGGRKGLPKSFLNRFTKVYIDKFESFDLLFITKNLFPQIEESDLKKMIQFNEELYHDTMVLCKYGKKGSPWEFNLRDLLRWCQLMTGNKSRLFDLNTSVTTATTTTTTVHHVSHNNSSHQRYKSYEDPALFVDLLYLQRMRETEDRVQVRR
jgi:midasin (ATPase involved in ribosome maturation)